MTTINNNIANAIRNIISNINDSRNDLGELRASMHQFEDAKKLAIILSRHSGVEGMRVNLNEERKAISEHHNGIFTSMALTFTWQGVRMVLVEDYEFESMSRSLILYINGEKVVKIFWSVNNGLSSNRFRDLTSNEEWFFIHILMGSIWKWSHTSSKMISLKKEIIVGGVTISPNEDGTAVMATINGETIPMMGHTLRGCIWWSNDPRLAEGIEVIKNAFTKPF